MEQQCPLCNGLMEVSEDCPNCGEVMVDSGRVTAYLGPYSAYLEQQSNKEKCVHLLACQKCGWDTRISVNTVPL